jgi:hypothetical protein
MIKLSGREGPPDRGQEHRPRRARLLITHDLATPARDLFARYTERIMAGNELDAYTGGFHLDALTNGVPLNVDLDTTLTVIAGILYWLLALKLDRYQNATPDKIWRDFLDATGTLHINDKGVTCALNLRSHYPVLIDAGFADLEVPIPWWNSPRPALPVPASLTSRHRQPQLNYYTGNRGLRGIGPRPQVARHRPPLRPATLSPDRQTGLRGRPSLDSGSREDSEHNTCQLATGAPCPYFHPVTIPSSAVRH